MHELFIDDDYAAHEQDQVNRQERVRAAIAKCYKSGVITLDERLALGYECGIPFDEKGIK